MRLFKTGLAVTMTLLVAEPLGMTYPFFAAIATIISMEATIANSYKAGKNRVKGTLLGAVTGLVFALVAQGNPLAAGVGIIFVLWTCNRMGWKNAISIACIVFLAIMINLDGDNPWIYSLNRLEDTLVGVGVALVVNFMVFPFNNESLLRKRYSDSLEMIASYLDRAGNIGYTRITMEGLSSFEAMVVDFKEQLVMYDDEVWLGRAHHLQMETLLKVEALLKTSHNHLTILADIEADGIIELPEVWRYHVDRLEDAYNRLIQIVL